VDHGHVTNEVEFTARLLEGRRRKPARRVTGRCKRLIEVSLVGTNDIIGKCDGNLDRHIVIGIYTIYIYIYIFLYSPSVSNVKRVTLLLVDHSSSLNHLQLNRRRNNVMNNVMPLYVYHMQTLID